MASAGPIHDRQELSVLYGGRRSDITWHDEEPAYRALVGSAIGSARALFGSATEVVALTPVRRGMQPIKHGLALALAPASATTAMKAGQPWRPRPGLSRGHEAGEPAHSFFEFCGGQDERQA